ncbi:hypothetical protein C8R45DRAFT_1115603 [Mycena sanguinolenta]|nr:hypothetical protein C8R45DRAFT_1115603 [Mycena sanguinolenta]
MLSAAPLISFLDAFLLLIKRVSDTLPERASASWSLIGVGQDMDYWAQCKFYIPLAARVFSVTPSCSLSPESI